MFSKGIGAPCWTKTSEKKLLNRKAIQKIKLLQVLVLSQITVLLLRQKQRITSPHTRQQLFSTYTNA